jgi:hypothetical protein
MFQEPRLLRRNAPQPKVEVNWDVIQAAGNDLMTKSGQVEHGFVLAGKAVPDAQTGVKLQVTRVLSAGSGSAGTFEVTPELAATVNNHDFGPDEKFLGFGHSHRRHHLDGISSGDREYAAAIGANKVHMMIKLNEDAEGNRDGGGKISVFDGNGYMDYSIVGKGGQRQDFQADVMGTTVEADRLKSDTDPAAPEQILAA